MAQQFLFANNAISTLAGPISNTATTVNLTAGSGALFPNPGSGQQFSLTLIDQATGLLNEIMYVTTRVTDTLTVVRAQEGTTALNWLAGDLAQSLVTAGQMQSFAQGVNYNPTRIVTASGVFVMSTSDYAIGLDRTSAVAASSTTLPSGATANQLFSIEDLAANFQAYPVTVNAPAGMSIANLSSVTLNENRQCAYFRYYGSSLWSVKF